MLFVIFQFSKERIFRAEGAFEPNHVLGIPCGMGMGITSTFAHGAGPLAALFLIPQRLSKEIFVGTNVLVFAWVNWIKMPFFCIDRTLVDFPLFAPAPLITRETLLRSLEFLPLVPVGVWMGVWLNRRFSEKTFTIVIHLFLFLTGLQLIFNFHPAKWFP